MNIKWGEEMGDVLINHCALRDLVVNITEDGENVVLGIFNQGLK